MSKIGLIISREFNERVRKRSFILTTVLTPLLMIGVIAAPFLVQRLGSSERKEILVSDPSGLVASALQSDGKVLFTPTDRSPEELRSDPGKAYGYLVVGAHIIDNPSDLQLYTFGPSTMEMERNIVSQVRRIVEAEKLKAYQIEDIQNILAEVRTQVSLQTFRLDSGGEEKASSSMLSMISAYFFGLLIYMFVFTYGAMVMHGVIEEKSSKVLEIIVSSVRPFQLMMGKILGIAAVAITQFMIWAVLLSVFGMVVLPLLGGDALAAAGTAGSLPVDLEGMDAGAMDALRTMTDPGFLFRTFGSFLIYFIGGYLLYAAMFAAIGSAVDNSQDSQQLQLPVTIPMIFALIVMFAVMQEPNSTLAVVFSLIPFTSPIVMMARIPYGVPVWELLASVLLLYGTFLAMVWLAGKVYRVGIFMYGKKPGFGELYKWMTYKS